MSAHIVMLLSNAFRPDPRVEREARALVEAGYRVTLICWDRSGELPARQDYHGIDVVRVQNVRSAYGSGWRQIFYTPRFWREAVRMASDLRPDAVHCHDLDTLYAGRMVKSRLGCRLVYDAHEDYATQMSLYLPGFLVRPLPRLERRLLRHVDLTLTASSVLADKLRSRGHEPVITIGNYQELEPFDAITPEEVAQARAGLGLSPDTYTVGYIGGFTRNRQLLPLVEAGGGLPDVQVLLWGDGHQRQAVEAAASRYSNVHYLGWLPAQQVPLYMRALDVVYYCLIPGFPGAVYNAPNTLSHAMAAGRPLIANQVGDLGRITSQEGCGWLVPEPTCEHIRQAVLELRDPVVRQKLGQAGRAAAERQYNWGAAKQLLIHAYEDLI